MWPRHPVWCLARHAKWAVWPPPQTTAREAIVPETEEVTTESPGRGLRVLMLSWEYPPVLVGGLGRHVHALATSLAAAGHQVTVVTRHAGEAPLDEVREGVRVVRA